jgi:DNA polymerase III delta prime subunit
VIIGKADVTELLLVALLTEGHVLLEDLPGIGKTMLARSVARSLDCTFARIQFTPDLLPSHVTGLNYYNQKLQESEFRPGPVLSQILLADREVHGAVYQPSREEVIHRFLKETDLAHFAQHIHTKLSFQSHDVILLIPSLTPALARVHDGNDQDLTNLGIRVIL